MFTHLFSKRSHTNAGEVVDREAGVSGIVCGEDARKAGAQDVILHSFLKFRHAHRLGQVLKQDLDEDTAARGRFLFVEMDDREDVPADGIGTQ